MTIESGNLIAQMCIDTIAGASRRNWSCRSALNPGRRRSGGSAQAKAARLRIGGADSVGDHWCCYFERFVMCCFALSNCPPCDLIECHVVKIR